MWEKWREEARQKAKKDCPRFKRKPLFIASMMLYWGEGNSKHNSAISLTNTSPEMLRIFNIFLQKYCEISIEKIRLALILYPDLNDKKCKNFCSKKIGVPVSQFHKTQFIKGRHPTKRLSYGICMIRINSRALKEKFLTWIDLYKQELTRE